MRKKIFGGIAVLATAIALSLTINSRADDKFSANVEALSENASALTVQCPLGATLCDWNCPNCSIKLGTIDGRNGIPTNIKGNCPNCNYSF